MCTAALVVLGTAGSARAEPATDPATPRYYLPVLQLRYLDPGSARVTGKGGESDLQVDSETIRLVGMAGHFFEHSRTVLAGSITYDHNHLRYGPAGEPQRSASLHMLQGRLALMQAIDQSWGTMAFVRAGVGSDFHGLGWADLRMSTGAALTHRWGESLQISAGVLYTNAFFNELVLPLLTIRYRHAPFRLDVLVPRGAAAWYAPLSQLELGLRFATLPLLHGIHDTEGLGDEYGHLNVLAGFAARFYLLHGAFVMGEAGYNARYYRVLQDQRITHELLSLHGMYGALSVGYMM